MMKPLTSIRSATAMRLLCAAALASVSLQTFAAGESCVTRSAAARVTVLELYTSEGCNSCPPADRWVSSLPAKGFTPDRVIALAFHVDYWDQLGWPDQLAKAQFSSRQRMQAERQIGQMADHKRHQNQARYQPYIAHKGLSSDITWVHVRLL